MILKYDIMMPKEGGKRILKKVKLKYIMIIPIVIILTWSLWYIHSNISYWSMDKYNVKYGVVTLNGIHSPMLNFFDDSNQNIGHIKLESKGSLYGFNEELIEDKDNFYFIGDTTGYAEKDYILQVNKKDYAQNKIYIDNNPSYITVDNGKLYIIDLLIGNFTISEVDIKTDKKRVYHIKENNDRLDSLMTYLHVEDGKFYYFKGDKNSVSMFTYDDGEKEIFKIKEFNNVHDAKFINDKIYILCSYIDHGEDFINKMTKSYSLVIYDKKSGTYKKVDIPIEKEDSKYFYGHLFVYGDKLILMEDVTSPLFKQGKKVRYYDLKKGHLLEMDVEKVPNDCRIIDGNIYFLSQDRLDIYNKDLRHIEKVKVSGAFRKKIDGFNRDRILLSK